MTGRLRGLLALSWPDRQRLALMMLMGLPSVALSLRMVGYVKTRGRIERISTRRDTHQATSRELENARTLARLASIAGRRGPISAKCLPQSLLIYCLLRREGLNPELKIGVRKQGNVMDAHAWVELDGQSLDPTEITHLPFQMH